MRFGVSAEARAGLDDLYRCLGPGVVEALAEIADDEKIAPSDIGTGELAKIRPRLGARYLAENHSRWKRGEPTSGFWRDRSLEGGATGLVVPLGDLEDEGNAAMARVADAGRRAAGEGQPPPRGLILLSRNAHFGNRPGVFSFDLVPSGQDAALAVNASVGQQHTLPGSLGEASGTTSGEPGAALLWEIQPNIYKPAGDRNRSAAPAFRRHRNWHLLTAIAAIAWLDENGYRTFVLRGRALQVTHEVNPDKPVTAAIEAFHDRTVAAAATALGFGLEDVDDELARQLVRPLANVALTREMERGGAGRLLLEAAPAGR